jgi:hypothetical protein
MYIPEIGQGKRRRPIASIVKESTEQESVKLSINFL